MRARPSSSRYRTVSLHLADVAHQVASSAHAVLVVDGDGFHIAGTMQNQGNIILPTLLPQVPELNPF